MIVATRTQAHDVLSTPFITTKAKSNLFTNRMQDK